MKDLMYLAVLLNNEVISRNSDMKAVLRVYTTKKSIFYYSEFI